MLDRHTGGSQDRTDMKANSTTNDTHMKVGTLGTAGGPRWWKGDAKDRAGISTAIVVKDRFYLVDAGHGVGRRIRQAGLELENLGGVFITHLHSDHTIEDRKSTRLNSSHVSISYAVFCLKK